MVRDIPPSIEFKKLKNLLIIKNNNILTKSEFECYIVTVYNQYVDT